MFSKSKQIANNTKNSSFNQIPSTSVNSSKIRLEKFKDNLTPINYQHQKITHQKTETYFQVLISKVKSTKLFTTSFHTGKQLNSNTKSFSDLDILNYIKNIDKSSIPQPLKDESEQALTYFYNFSIDLRNLYETGSQEEIDSFISNFYSPNNPYSSYFRGEIYHLIKSIHESSSHSKNSNINPKDFAYGIYKILDPSFEVNSLDNLYVHNNGSSSKIFQKTHELLDAIDLARSCENGIEVHLTNDNDWNKVLSVANIDSSYIFVGKLSQTNMDLLIVDRINKVYYCMDLKSRFYIKGFSINTNHLLNLGNIPEHERNIIEISQKNELLKNLRNKLNSPNITDDQRDQIKAKISEVFNSKVPLNTTNAMLPHINTGYSTAVSAVIYSNGSPDRKNIPLGLDQDDVDNVII